MLRGWWWTTVRQTPSNTGLPWAGSRGRSSVEWSRKLGSPSCQHERKPSLGCLIEDSQLRQEVIDLNWEIRTPPNFNCLAVGSGQKWVQDVGHVTQREMATRACGRTPGPSPLSRVAHPLTLASHPSADRIKSQTFLRNDTTFQHEGQEVVSVDQLAEYWGPLNWLVHHQQPSYQVYKGHTNDLLLGQTEKNPWIYPSVN